MDPDEEFMMWYPPPFDEEFEQEPPPRQPSNLEILFWKIILALFALSLRGCLLLFVLRQ